MAAGHHRDRRRRERARRAGERASGGEAGEEAVLLAEAAHDPLRHRLVPRGELPHGDCAHVNVDAPAGAAAEEEVAGGGAAGGGVADGDVDGAVEGRADGGEGGLHALDAGEEDAVEGRQAARGGVLAGLEELPGADAGALGEDEEPEGGGGEEARAAGEVGELAGDVGAVLVPVAREEDEVEEAPEETEGGQVDEVLLRKRSELAVLAYGPRNGKHHRKIGERDVVRY